LRNGPDAKYLPDNKSHHWFDGDAMVHAMRIKDGELYYVNRWLESDRFKMETEADHAIITRVGEMAYKGGLFKLIFGQLKHVVGYGIMEQVNKLTIGSPNTAITHHSQ
jgi:carotenoid 9,10(9',10')-cleavage dioxygenase 1